MTMAASLSRLPRDMVLRMVDTPLGTVLPRHTERAVHEALSDTRVVLINGARQCGKSTLAGLVATDMTAEWRDLDDAVTRQAAVADPTGFVDFPRMVIDEIQRVPELLLAVKAQVDRDPLIKRIPAWSRNVSHRAAGTPKVAFVDSGVAANLLGADAGGLVRPGGMFGPLLEGFVLMELARQLTWAEERVELYHYRTKDGVEVDAVLENRQGRVVGIEVKAAATVRAEDFRGLRHLADRLGDDFVAGVVLYTGEQTFSFGDRMLAMPVAALREVG